jgi:tRNA U34 5-methylaminomethyl-2-thiouridine-forming methyltransferase MnmC
LDIQSVDFENQFDLIYYDAFAPTAQPELWEEPVMERMQRALVPGGVLVTYCAKGAFKRTLKGLGFEVETLQGPPGKREMTRAIRV